MLPKLFFCVKVVIRVVDEGGCQSSELIVEVGCSKVLSEYVAGVAFAKVVVNIGRWSLSSGVVIGGQSWSSKLTMRKWSSEYVIRVW